MNNRTLAVKLLGWICGILFSAIGVVNIFWGNDALFGVFLLLLSLVHYPPLHALFRKPTGYRVHSVVQVALGLFILWVSLGVGELFNKIDLPVQSF
ncbi:MAG: hypothetical protein HYU71_11255 [Bacteroidetes bacterium]|nr:hypothetical protein [Bacteroidota bacterium]